MKCGRGLHRPHHSSSHAFKRARVLREQPRHGGISAALRQSHAWKTHQLHLQVPVGPGHRCKGLVWLQGRSAGKAAVLLQPSLKVPQHVLQRLSMLHPEIHSAARASDGCDISLEFILCKSCVPHPDLSSPQLCRPYCLLS